MRFRQGLDLQGGLHVRFQANPPPEQQLQDGDMDAVKRIIENRVNALGVAEPLIQIEGDNRLIVELPRVEDPEEAIRLFRQTGQLLVINTGFDFIDEGTLLPRRRFADGPGGDVTCGMPASASTRWARP